MDEVTAPPRAPATPPPTPSTPAPIPLQTPRPTINAGSSGGPNEPRGGPRRFAGIAIFEPLRNRDFALLWMGMAVSLLVDGISFVAIAWQVLRLENAATALSLVGVAWTVPQVLFLLFAGVMSDRFERRKVLVLADVTRAISIGGIGLLTISGSVELWHILVLVAFYGTGDALFMPAFGAIVPDIVPNNRLVEANSLDQFVRPLMLRFVGPAVGGLIVTAVGAGPAFLIDAGTFCLSAVCVLLMRRTRRSRREAIGPPGVVREISEGLRFVKTQTWLWVSLIAQAVGLLCFFGPLQVLVPIIVKDNLNGTAGDYGIVLAAGGVGAIIASIAMAQRGLPRRSVTVMFMNLAAGTFVFTFFAVVHATWQAMLVSFFMTATFTVGIIVWGTLMHKLVPSDLLGRVSSLDWMVSTTLIPLSFALTGPIAHAIGEEATLAGAGVLGGGLILAFLLTPGLRRIETDPRLHERSEPAAR
ncbi:MAG: MFS transporter [Actinomycetota bacterium]